MNEEIKSTPRERVVIEQKELLQRLESLKNFIDSGKVQNLKVNEQKLLKKQYRVMKKYYSILRARLTMWSADVKTDKKV